MGVVFLIFGLFGFCADDADFGCGSPGAVVDFGEDAEFEVASGGVLGEFGGLRFADFAELCDACGIVEVFG